MSKTKQIELGKKILGKEGFPATSFQRVSRGRFGSKNKYPHPNILKHLYCVEEDDNFRQVSVSHIKQTGNLITQHNYSDAGIFHSSRHP